MFNSIRHRLRCWRQSRRLILIWFGTLPPGTVPLIYSSRDKIDNIERSERDLRFVVREQGWVHIRFESEGSAAKFANNLKRQRIGTIVFEKPIELIAYTEEGHEDPNFITGNPELLDVDISNYNEHGNGMLFSQAQREKWEELDKQTHGE